MNQLSPVRPPLTDSAAPTPTESGLVQRLGDFPTMLDALEYAARGQSGINFFSVKGELTYALTYRDLRGAARRLASRLLGFGLRIGERVAIVAETHPDFVVAFFACQYAGLVPAPLPLPVAFGGRAGYLSHVRRLVTEARAAALFAPAALADWLAPLTGDTDLRFCGTVADLDTADGSGNLPPADPDGVAYLQFSSGSTRFPLGVVVHQRALMANAAAMLTHGLQVRRGDRGISWLPLYHDMGLVGFLIAPMAGQVTMDLLATQDFARRPLLWLSLISRLGCTVSYSPSFGYDLCVRRARLAAGLALDLSSWRVAGIGGDMIRPAVLATFADTFAAQGFDRRTFLPSYGMAEATLAISFAPVGAGIQTDTVDLDRLERENLAVSPRDDTSRPRTLVLCGSPLPGHDVQIRDASGRALARREVGRIHVRGPSLMRGYDGRPAETAAVLSADGWLDTGDLGYWLDGSLVITGRAKDLIIINGRNIWPQDLEWTIEQSVPEVRTGNIAAFSVEEDGQEILVLAAEARMQPGQVARDALTTVIGDTLRTQHGLESRVVLLPANTLPYTSSGKLSRSATRLRYLAGTLAPA